MPDRQKKIRGDDPRFQSAKLRGDCRKLELPDGVWQWKVNADRAFIYDPDGNLTDVPLYTILEMTREEWEAHHDQNWDENSTIPIEPHDIKGWIIGVKEEANRA